MVDGSTETKEVSLQLIGLVHTVIRIKNYMCEEVLNT